MCLVIFCYCAQITNITTEANEFNLFFRVFKRNNIQDTAKMLLFILAGTNQLPIELHFMNSLEVDKQTISISLYTWAMAQADWIHFIQGI